MPDALPPSLQLLERRLGVEEGTLSGPDKVRAEDALLDATALALAEVPAGIALAWTTSPPLVAQVVILKAARREFENPQGFVTEGLGEHSATVSVASGVFLTDAEKAQLHRAAGLTPSTTRYTGTIRTPSAYESAHRALPRASAFGLHEHFD